MKINNDVMHRIEVKGQNKSLNLEYCAIRIVTRLKSSFYSMVIRPTSMLVNQECLDSKDNYINYENTQMNVWHTRIDKNEVIRCKVRMTFVTYNRRKVRLK